MKRRNKALQTHQSGAELVLSNPEYKQWVFRYTFLELQKDLVPNGDITTHLIPDSDRTAIATFIAKENGIVCGLDELKYFLVEGDKSFRPYVSGDFIFNTDFCDGDRVAQGDVVLEIIGKFSDLMMIERVSLNLIMRMSGISTLTSELLDITENKVLISPTRKTLWGLLDKKACFIGGGCTHRLNLSDAVLIKDTHLDFLSHNLQSLNLHLLNNNTKFFEIEVSDLSFALAAADFLNKSNLLREQKCLILFDNMPPSDISDAISKIFTAYGDDILFEASGGINKNTILDYSKCGVDIVSLGSLTHSVKALDFSCKVQKK